MIDENYVTLVIVLAIIVRTVFAFVRKFYQFRDEQNTSTAGAIAKTLVFDHMFIITGIVGGFAGWLGFQFVLKPLDPSLPDFFILLLSFGFAYLGNDILNRGIGH